jgi:hypothetical protein
LYIYLCPPLHVELGINMSQQGIKEVPKWITKPTKIKLRIMSRRQKGDDALQTLTSRCTDTQKAVEDADAKKPETPLQKTIRNHAGKG